MSPQLLQLIVFGLQQAIQAAPAVVADFQALFANGAPTDADFDALRSKVAGESYAQFVPASAIAALTIAATLSHSKPK